jgi:hypothetical protein
VAAAWVVSLALLWAAARLLLRAKRYTAPTALALLERDPRPPVLYFRSFTADRVTAKGVVFSSWFSEEEQLARVLRGVGPFVAIGQPGEVLPALGAARLYVGDAEWRRVVAQLTARAAVVLLRTGASPGLVWELENAVRRLRPEQLVLLVPRDARLSEEFRRRAQWVLPRGLPPLDGRGRRRLFRGSLQAVVVFDAQWTPAVVDLQALSLPLLRRSPAYPLVPVLQTALAPVFHRLGVPWQPPGISSRMVLSIVSLVVLVLSLAALYA